MQIIHEAFELNELKNSNTFIGNLPELKNSSITFYGRNNILICDNGVKLEDSNIEFGANNSIIFLSKNRFSYKLNIKTFNNSTIYFGENNYFNNNINIVVSEETNLIVGRDCMFSFGVVLTTTDHHLIYEIDTLQRVNFSKSIVIGDHVWIGLQSTILKGSNIDSGSVIGACTVVANKFIKNNSCYVGNPARCIKENILWEGTSTHKWTSNEISKFSDYREFIKGKDSRELDDFIFKNNESEMVDFEMIERLSYLPVEGRILFLKSLSVNNNRNRFVHNDTRFIKSRE